MLPFDFWHRYTFAEFSTKSYYFFRNRDTDFKDRWEQTRSIVRVLVAANGGNAAEVMPFTWDKEKEYEPIKPISKEEAENIFKRYAIKKK